jgi:two-component system chemotaxis response regulator CheY
VGDLKMMYPWHMSALSRSGPLVQPRPETMFAPVVCPGIEPHRSAPSRNEPWPQPRRSAEGDRKGTDTSSFILIVDDDPDLLDVTSFVIESEGMAVETARNGEEALALLRAGRVPELVLLDLMMPVMNGWEFLDEIAKDPSLQPIPIVVLTATERTEVPGAIEVLNKPMDLTALLQVVEHYVRGGD